VSGGTVTAVGIGKATITVASKEDTSKTAQCAVTVTEASGKLSVNGADLVDKNGKKIQLFGMSTHGLAWFPEYVNLETFKILSEEWNTNCIRLAMYTAESNGYCTNGNKENLKSIVKNGVDYATQLGMYVIIDWHILNENTSDYSKRGDPNIYKDEAKKFFAEMSALYKNHKNVLYEICNEPNGSAVTWELVKTYANEVIPVIRANDPDSVIIVGTPTWSQDIHSAAQSPLAFDNIMYALHFYAGTHKDSLRSRLKTCVSQGLPVFISEFAICDASGNGANDTASGEEWMKLIKEYNLSFMAWNLAHANESSSILVNKKLSGWTDDDLKEWGKWIRAKFQQAGK
jgi:endoglucanase